MVPKRMALAGAVTVFVLVFLSPAKSFGAPGDYTVAAGDTLSGIAVTYGVGVDILAEANAIADPDLIMAGQVLRIPGMVADAAEADSGTDRWSGGAGYTVRLGDTLTGIAERTGVPVGAIVEANDLADPHLIVEGQTLTIPVVEGPLVGPSAPAIEALLEQFAVEEGLEVGLVKALAYVESGWQQHVVSPTGAVGVMQVQPSTGYWLETDVFGYDLNIETSAHDNIRAGVRYLSLLADLTGSIDQAMAAYYQGYAALSLGIIYDDTVQYVATVNAIRDAFWP